MKGSISQSFEYSESEFGLESFALAVWYLHGTYRHTWVSTHKKHSQTQIRKHTKANRHSLFFSTHANTQSGLLPVHTQQHTYSVCLSLHETATLLFHRSVHQLLLLLCPHIASCFSSLPVLYPFRPAYHVPTVSLPINAHRAALQWGWRVPQQQAQYRVYRHACTCQPGRARGRGGDGREGGRGRLRRGEKGGGERKSKGEWTSERRICWVRQTARRCATLHIHTGRHVNVCTDGYETKDACSCALWEWAQRHAHTLARAWQNT